MNLLHVIQLRVLLKCNFLQNSIMHITTVQCTCTIYFTRICQGIERTFGERINAKITTCTLFNGMKILVQVLYSYTLVWV